MLWKKRLVQASIGSIGIAMIIASSPTEVTDPNCWSSTDRPLPEEWAVVASDQSSIKLNNNIYFLATHRENQMMRIFQYSPDANHEFTVLGEVELDDSQTAHLSARLLSATTEELFFTADANGLGVELWRLPLDTPGLTNTAELVADLNPGTASSEPNWLENFGNLLVLNGNTESNGREMVLIDRTTGTPTVEIIDLAPGTATSDPYRPARIGNEIFFSAKVSDSGRELWRWNPMSEQTPAIAVEFQPGSSGGLDDTSADRPGYGKGFGDELYVSVRTDFVQDDVVLELNKVSPAAGMAVERVTGPFNTAVNNVSGFAANADRIYFAGRSGMFYTNRNDDTLATQVDSNDVDGQLQATLAASGKQAYVVSTEDPSIFSATRDLSVMFEGEEKLSTIVKNINLNGSAIYAMGNSLFYPTSNGSVTELELAAACER